jgi:hypothetical protein
MRAIAVEDEGTQRLVIRATVFGDEGKQRLVIRATAVGDEGTQQLPLGMRGRRSTGMKRSLDEEFQIWPRSATTGSGVWAEKKKTNHDN